VGHGVSVGCSGQLHAGVGRQVASGLGCVGYGVGEGHGPGPGQVSYHLVVVGNGVFVTVGCAVRVGWIVAVGVGARGVLVGVGVSTGDVGDVNGMARLPEAASTNRSTMLNSLIMVFLGIFKFSRIGIKHVPRLPDLNRPPHFADESLNFGDLLRLQINHVALLQFLCKLVSVKFFLCGRLASLRLIAVCGD